MQAIFISGCFLAMTRLVTNPPQSSSLRQQMLVVCDAYLREPVHGC
jgi:hypothetical protein